MPDGQTMIRCYVIAIDGTWISWKHKHADNWVFLHQPIIKLQNLVSRNNHLLLLLPLPFLDSFRIVWRHTLVSFLSSLEVVQELVESFWHFIFVLMLIAAAGRIFDLSINILLIVILSFHLYRVVF